MKIKYGVNKRDLDKYNTSELRDEFLISNIFEVNKINLTYSHIDRIIFGGVIPLDSVNLDVIDCNKSLGSSYFLENREMGIINIGGKGNILVDNIKYEIDNMEALYISKGSKNIIFNSNNKESLSKFYIVSTVAHKEYETKLIKKEMVTKVELGDKSNCNERIIYKYFNPDVVNTSSLLMGLTMLKDGSIWNTMPAHTHDRRMEVYMYFNVDCENVVFHLMGEPNNTKHLVVKNEECVISPSYSIHSGVGTKNYNFIWAMTGENKNYDDMNSIEIKDLL